jgi:hypothetical protein
MGGRLGLMGIWRVLMVLILRVGPDGWWVEPLPEWAGLVAQAV